jgi:CRISPR-associated protein Cmr2
MGRLLQELDSPEVYRAFSKLVDDSVRQACYEALSAVCTAEIQAARAALQAGYKPQAGKELKPLPADILLLGGDDLLVLLPAERALDFALKVTAAFERLTREQQAELAEAARRFFAERGLADRGLTISCGVAIGPANYPFYLLRDLAEELMRSAKRRGSEDPQKTDYWAPSYIDFHQLAGSVSQDLESIRQEDYRTDSDHPRTLRPYRRDDLEKLRQAALRLQQAKIPRSKLHDLFEAALEPRWLLAQTRCRELFGRLREDKSHHERRGLWEALGMLGSIDLFSYPWLKNEPRNGPTSPTALVDLVEAHDLFMA